MAYQKCNTNGSERTGFGFNLNNFMQAIDDFLDGNNLRKPFGGHSKDAAQTTPPANVWEDSNGLTIELAAVGLQKEDFQLTFEKDVLTIAAETTVKKTAENVKIHRNEFGYATFKRSFRLDSKQFDNQRITARYEQGILTIQVPFRAPAADNNIRIQVL